MSLKQNDIFNEHQVENFLPTGYIVPDKSNGYMKFRPGSNRIRILASPIIGYEWWIDVESGRKPVRVPMNGRIPAEFGDTVKHFWAMPVWNYELNQVQILEITQKGIQKTIKSLADNTKWGTPLGYDINIEKSGEGLETEYSVTPEPKERLDEGIKEIFSKVTVNLGALFDGKDPFSEPVEEEIDLEEIETAFDNSKDN